MKHPNIADWQRHEDGSYRAEKNGWLLTVKWKPESPKEHRGFFWVAETPTGEKVLSNELHEEIEIAMAEAEELAAGSGMAA